MLGDIFKKILNKDPKTLSLLEIEKELDLEFYCSDKCIFSSNELSSEEINKELDKILIK